VDALTFVNKDSKIEISFEHLMDKITGFGVLLMGDRVDIETIELHPKVIDLMMRERGSRYEPSAGWHRVEDRFRGSDIAFQMRFPWGETRFKGNPQLEPQKALIYGKGVSEILNIATAISSEVPFGGKNPANEEDMKLTDERIAGVDFRVDDFIKRKGVKEAKDNIDTDEEPIDFMAELRKL
jgi:hypothetical protein